LMSMSVNNKMSTLKGRSKWTLSGSDITIQDA
jgi:hypothetical protein